MRGGGRGANYLGFRGGLAYPYRNGAGTHGHPDFETPSRPGFYAGNRQFRMDKVSRDQPLEKQKIDRLHERAVDEIEKLRKPNREIRDQRNRPSHK